MAKYVFDADKFKTAYKNLKSKGSNADEIAEALNTEGFRTPKGKKLSSAWLYSAAAKKVTGGKRKTTTTNRVARKMRDGSDESPSNLDTVKQRYVKQILNDRELNDSDKIQLLRNFS